MFLDFYASVRGQWDKNHIPEIWQISVSYLRKINANKIISELFSTVSYARTKTFFKTISF